MAAPELDPTWWAAAEFEGVPLRQALAGHQIGLLFRFLRSRGVSRARIARHTGLSETRVRAISQGAQRVSSYEVLERLAEGLRIPRHLLGISFDPPPPTREPLLPRATENDVSAWNSLLPLVAAATADRGLGDSRGVVLGQLRLITQACARAPAKLRSNLLVVEARWLEFLAWIEDNRRAYADANRHLRRAFDLATAAGDDTVAAYVLMRRSQQAIEHLDPAGGIALAQQAQLAGIALPDRVRALAIVREAEGHALTGDDRDCLSALDRAGHLLQEPSGDDPLAGHCTAVYVSAHRARCLQLLGRADAAAEELHALLANQSAMPVDQALWFAWLADAYAAQHEVDAAAVAGLRALDLASTAGSARALRAIAPTAQALRRHRGVSTVDQFLANHRQTASTWKD
ncbi:hypothetical protein GCM10010123_17360 [Pilimelia anulata]|uniref:HTH cro/C1-type domain-containing protein n=1 Tax=Pilimelia anulata TaxID=53371 RepID=A0A8J3B2S7_9ACTN|nr:helix-turn-helix transcriptional regulator [Pilimelia anulata]GGJ88295.1 hypothetical protein GCM10010123_17360 [Pilimelia anulata]